MSLTSVQRYVAAVTAAAILVIAAVVYVGGRPSSNELEAALFFAAFGALAHALGYQVSRGTVGSIGFLPFLSAAALVPGGATILAVMLAVAAGETLRKQTLIRGVFNVAQHSLALGLSILSFRALGGKPLLQNSATILDVLPLLALSSVYQTMNKFAVTVVVSLSNGRPIFRPWLTSMKTSFLYDVLAMPLVALFAFAFKSFGPVWSICLALPMLGVRQLYKTNFELEKTNEELLQLMVATIEARDPYTSGHSQRVAEYSRMVSQAAGLGAKAASRVFTAALLHDVGKIYEEFAPILRKPGRLTDEEYGVMKTHAEKGASLVAKVSRFVDLVEPIRSHHEAWDGSGYPNARSGDQIPLWARIIAFADTVDAMTTDRPYREALGTDSVRAEIRIQAGRQFDPRISLALVSDQHWPTMAEAIRRNRVGRSLTPRAMMSVPRHSASRSSVSAS